jgi:hypothetical protein
MRNPIFGVRINKELKEAIFSEARRLRVKPSELVRMTMAERLTVRLQPEGDHLSEPRKERCDGR